MASHPLLREAILITKELGDVVFIGDCCYIITYWKG